MADFDFVEDWLNEMADWPVGKVRAVLSDPTVSENQRAAAELMMRAVSNEVDEQGYPVRHAAYRKMMWLTHDKEREAMERVDALFNTLGLTEDERKFATWEAERIRVSLLMAMPRKGLRPIAIQAAIAAALATEEISSIYQPRRGAED